MVLLDMRTRQEYCQGHIIHALLVPTPPPPLTEREEAVLKDQLWWTLSQNLTTKSTPIVVYCRKGIRAKIAKKLIQQLGYPKVIAWGGVEEEPLRQIFGGALAPSLLCYHDPSPP